MAILNAGSLDSILRAAKIPMDHWKKTVPELLAEIMAGECHLRIGLNGLERVLEIVKMVVKDPSYPERGFLKEVSITLPSGKMMERNREPAGKRRVGQETPEEALKREAGEELELEPGKFSYNLVMTYEEKGNPKSAYPGLPSVYVIHWFGLIPCSDSKLLLNEFDITEKDGTCHHFKWVAE